MASSVDERSPTKPRMNSNIFALLFLFLIASALISRVFQKLQTIPMHDHAVFLVLSATAVNIPLCFAYILPMEYLESKSLSRRQMSFPLLYYVLLSLLDTSVGILQTFSSIYLSGPIFILLMQSCIPFALMLSKCILRSQYTRKQYIGSFIVAIGVIVVLYPKFARTNYTYENPLLAVFHSSDSFSIALWMLIMVLSCIPMCLSTIYKEKLFLDLDLNPIYLNGYVSLFQFIFSFLSLAFLSPYISQTNLNIWNELQSAWSCYTGACPNAMSFVTLFLVSNALTNVFCLLTIQYSSTMILSLAFTLVVPLVNFVFILPSIPGHTNLEVEDTIGLAVICLGLVLFSFIDSSEFNNQFQSPKEKKIVHTEQEEEMHQPLMEYTDD